MSSADAANDLYRLIDGYKVSQAIHVAAVLGVADHIAAGRDRAESIAEASGAHSGSLYRLLRSLASIGVLHETENRTFSLTPMGDVLRTDADASLAPFAIMNGQDNYWSAWGRLLHGVTTGENVFTAVHGVGSWTYRERHPDQNAIFSAAMTANARRVDPIVAEALDCTDVHTIADIGGGQGSLVSELLRVHPRLQAVLFDRPSVVAGATSVLSDAGVLSRVTLVGGDMLTSVPADADAYLLKFVLHDWRDDDALRILRAVRTAAPSHARVFVVERLIGAPNTNPRAAFSDLNMLVGPGGRERTREEFEALLAASGFRLTRVQDTSAGLHILSGAAA
jgi:hypothetical protein